MIIQVVANKVSAVKQSYERVMLRVLTKMLDIGVPMVQIMYNPTMLLNLDLQLKNVFHVTASKLVFSVTLLCDDLLLDQMTLF